MVDAPAPGRLVVLAGPSAVGKSTVVRRLREEIPDLHFSVSMTTRAPRPGEVDGEDYVFVDPETFQRRIDAGEMLEWAEIHGGLQRSGTPAEPIRAARAVGRPVLAEVDIVGAHAIKEKLPGAVTVFLAPPSWEELVSRLTGRGTESREVIDRRLETARREMADSGWFDHVVVNEQVEETVAAITAMLQNHPGAGTGPAEGTQPTTRTPVSNTMDTEKKQPVFDPPVGITDPPIDRLLERVSSKYALVIFAAKRARDINNHYEQDEGMFISAPPKLHARAGEKPLSLALREIDAGAIDHEEGR